MIPVAARTPPSINKRPRPRPSPLRTEMPVLLLLMAAAAMADPEVARPADNQPEKRGIGPWPQLQPDDEKRSVEAKNLPQLDERSLWGSSGPIDPWTRTLPSFPAKRSAHVAPPGTAPPAPAPWPMPWPGSRSGAAQPRESPSSFWRFFQYRPWPQ